MKLNNSGLTLIEIMIVALIISLLASIAIPNIIRARVNASEAVAQNNLKAISSAMETFLSTNDMYPSTTTALLTATPPYLQVDFFTGTHDGYTFTIDSLSNSIYSFTAAPIGATQGTKSFTISTGSVLVTN